MSMATMCRRSRFFCAVVALWLAAPSLAQSPIKPGRRPSAFLRNVTVGGKAPVGLPDVLSSPVPFTPVTPCRVADTRLFEGKTGAFGPPVLAPGTVRTIPVPQSPCGIPAGAAAYSVNVTVVPVGPLAFLTVYPTGQARPPVSTLNAFDGAIVANAAVVPAGANGAIDVYVTDRTEVILDINGYFGVGAAAGSVQFYTVAPCRVMDTRAGEGKSGPFGPPVLSAGTQRDVPVPQGGCGVPATARAYSVNITVVPRGPLAFLSAWPAGLPRPLVSTLNSFQGKVVANAALVPAGTNGAISVFVPDASDVIIDVNGYLAP